MDLTLRGIDRPTWVGTIGKIRVYLDDQSGAPVPAQVEIARQLADALAAVSARAAAYLDLFVDRARACGNGDEPWWLDEVDLRRRDGDHPSTYALVFSLDGDDGGMWTVDLRVTGAEHRPVRFERRQG